MTIQKTINEIPLLGGHPALDFVNTVDSRGERWGPEFLNTYGDLASWARRLRLIDDGEYEVLLWKAAKSPTKALRKLNDAQELREALHHIFLTESEDRQILKRDLARLNEVVRHAQLQKTLTSNAGIIEWSDAAAAELDAISMRIGWLAVDLLTSRRDRRPIRACPGPNCRWLFLDQSRNGHRRWCSDKTCGSLSRVRKFRAVSPD